MCLNNIGIILVNQNKFNDALQSFEQLIEIEKRVLPESDLDLGISYANIASKEKQKYSTFFIYFLYI